MASSSPRSRFHDIPRFGLFTDDHDQLRALVRDFVQRELAPFAEREIQSLRLLNANLRDSIPRLTTPRSSRAVASPSPGRPLRFDRFDPTRYAPPRPSFPQPVPYPRPHP